MKNLRLLIIDDNRALCSKLAAAFSDVGDIDVLPPYYDAYSVMDVFDELKPDVALIDALMPEVDGIELVTRLKANDAGKQTKFIIMSPFQSDEVMRLMNSIGVTYFISLPMSVDMIVKRVLSVAAGDEQERARLMALAEEKRRDFTRDELITNYLRMLGVPAHLIGYTYVRDAIDFYVGRFSKRPSLTHDVYPYVSSLRSSTDKRVERCIRNAIELTWDRCNVEAQHQLFGYTVDDKKGRPTNKEFIAMIADRVVTRLKYRRS